MVLSVKIVRNVGIGSLKYNTFGSAVEMPNGDIFIFYANDNEISTNTTYVMYIVSHDGGLTWSSPQIFCSTPNKRSWSPFTFREGNTVYVFWVIDQDTGLVDAQVWWRKTTNSGATWSNATLAVNNHSLGDALQIIKHGSNYIMSAFYGVSSQDFRAYALKTTNIEGTWTKGADVTVSVPRGAMEPSICLLSNGNLCMIIRTDTGYLCKAISTNDGDTWGSAVSSGIQSPEAMARVLRLANGKLLIIWNNVSSTSQTPRYPLTAGISSDDFTTLDKTNINTEAGNTQITNMGVLCQLANSNVIFGYEHYSADSGTSVLDVAILSGADLQNPQGVTMRARCMLTLKKVYRAIVNKR
jgi:hypothetical protein